MYLQGRMVLEESGGKLLPYREVAGYLVGSLGELGGVEEAEEQSLEELLSETLLPLPEQVESLEELLLLELLLLILK